MAVMCRSVLVFLLAILTQSYSYEYENNRWHPPSFQSKLHNLRERLEHKFSMPQLNNKLSDRLGYQFASYAQMRDKLRNKLDDSEEDFSTAGLKMQSLRDRLRHKFSLPELNNKLSDRLGYQFTSYPELRENLRNTFEESEEKLAQFTDRLRERLAPVPQKFSLPKLNEKLSDRLGYELASWQQISEKLRDSLSLPQLRLKNRFEVPQLPVRKQLTLPELPALPQITPNDIRSRILGLVPDGVTPAEFMSLVGVSYPKYVL